MISSQLESSASQIGLELPDECNYCQELLLDDTILSFRLAQHVATISNYPLLSCVVKMAPMPTALASVFRIKGRLKSG